MDETDHFFLVAFDRLCTERSYPFGAVGPIPWSKIVWYCERSGLEGDIAEASASILNEMDKGYLNHISKK